MAPRKFSPNDSAYSSASVASITSPQAGNWTTSQVYTSPELQIRQEYQRMLQQQVKARAPNGNGIFFHSSPFIPMTFQEYLQHREARLRDNQKELEATIQARQELRQARRRNPACAEAMPVYGGQHEWNRVVVPLEGYEKMCWNWRPAGADVVTANQGFDRSRSFDMQARGFVGNSLMQKL